MKIRTGFVSNSSTSSFCIYGCFLDQDKAIKLFVKAGILTEPAANNSWGACQMGADEIGVKFYTGESDLGAYFGFDFTNIPDDVNVGEWKQEKEEVLKKIFGEEISCYVYLEAWANY